jgi:hypothetical protein
MNICLCVAIFDLSEHLLDVSGGGDPLAESGVLNGRNITLAGGGNGGLHNRLGLGRDQLGNQEQREVKTKDAHGYLQ